MKKKFLIGVLILLLVSLFTFACGEDSVAVKGLKLDKQTITVSVEGSGEQLSCVFTPENATNQEVVWSSDNEAIATVDANGIVTGVSAGKTNVKATAADTSTGKKVVSCQVTVIQPIKSVEVDTAHVRIGKGKNVTVKATTLPENATNKKLNWISDDATIAKVTPAGQIVGANPGKTKITCEAADGFGASCTIEVEVIQLAQGMKSDSASLSILPNGSSPLPNITITPADSTYNLEWASSNEDVCVINDQNEIMAVGLGNCDLTCTDTESGKSVKMKVTVGVSFGGKTIKIVNYWLGKLTSGDKKAAKLVNANVKATTGGDWGSQVQDIEKFVQSRKKEYRAYIIPLDFLSDAIKKGVITYTQEENPANKPADGTFAYTLNGKTYGYMEQYCRPGQCLYFNKTVLERAGIDWNTIYEMQTNGQWTWEEFEKLLAVLSQNANGDYALTGSNVDLYRIAVFSNNGSFFDINENGKLFVNAGSEESLEALNWSKKIWETYGSQQPKDGNWDYYKEAFKAGNIGFYIYQAYGGFQAECELEDMKDPWGCVAFPIGPKGTTYVTIADNNIYVVPKAYSIEDAEKLLIFCDTLAKNTETTKIGNKKVDEQSKITYSMLTEKEHIVIDYTYLLGSLNNVLGNDFLWSFQMSDPEDLVKQKTPIWEEIINQLDAVQ